MDNGQWIIDNCPLSIIHSSVETFDYVHGLAVNIHAVVLSRKRFLGDDPAVGFRESLRGVGILPLRAMRQQHLARGILVNLVTKPTPRWRYGLGHLFV